jgi:nicotinate-nucleotide pyrophosphorylase (carboxylating)
VNFEKKKKANDRFTMNDYETLVPKFKIRKLVLQWLEEDVPSFDIGGFVVGNARQEASIEQKADGVLCGRPFVDAVFDELDCTVQWHVDEGTHSVASNSNRCRVATVSGAASKLLLGERIALNVLARASAIASKCRRLLAVADNVSGFRGSIAGTRKTVCGLRLLEKYAFVVGGADAHRYDLSQMIMIKDNHVASVGSISGAVAKARQVSSFAVKIEVECESVDDAREAIAAGADIIMLDNFAPDELRDVARQLREEHSSRASPSSSSSESSERRQHSFLIEASGGITETSLAQYCSPHVDIVSMGSLTQSITHVDFSLNIVKSSLSSS